MLPTRWQVRSSGLVEASYDSNAPDTRDEDGFDVKP